MLLSSMDACRHMHACTHTHTHTHTHTPTLVPRNSGGLILRCLGSKVPHRVTHNVRSYQLLHHIQQTGVRPQIPKGLQYANCIERERGRQRQRETQRQKDRQIDRQTQRDRERDGCSHTILLKGSNSITYVTQGTEPILPVGRVLN